MRPQTPEQAIFGARFAELDEYLLVGTQGIEAQVLRERRRLVKLAGELLTDPIDPTDRLFWMKQILELDQVASALLRLSSPEGVVPSVVSTPKAKHVRPQETNPLNIALGGAHLSRTLVSALLPSHAHAFSDLVSCDREQFVHTIASTREAIGRAPAGAHGWNQQGAMQRKSAAGSIRDIADSIESSRGKVADALVSQAEACQDILSYWAAIRMCEEHHGWKGVSPISEQVEPLISLGKRVVDIVHKAVMHPGTGFPVDIFATPPRTVAAGEVLDPSRGVRPTGRPSGRDIGTGNNSIT